ncbi:methyltransferase domain-containing protein [Armatimonas sp.]|uniref:methyltransferase domain-containing protein n=1 Tax=Armatimonas sp. TaxID=1872638 RepID=UPI00286C711C|nr:methyltransferase domain-containing protein [Armatimonas sp.]
MDTMYDSSFFDSIEGYAKTSALILHDMLKEIYSFDSVVDVGCGNGAWLSVFQEKGVKTIKGIDGSYVDQSQLRIPKECFHPHDLTQPVSLNQRFDLAISLEVGEHLPEARAVSFVADIVAFSDVVLFSAALPGQGGTYHINEQWPTYWAHLFAQHDYVAFDCFRPRLWNRKNIAWYYAQNIVLYVKREVAENGKLNATFLGAPGAPLSLIHPLLFHFRTVDPGIGPIVRSIPQLMNQALRKRLKGETTALPNFE